MEENYFVWTFGECCAMFCYDRLVGYSMSTYVWVCMCVFVCMSVFGMCFHCRVFRVVDEEFLEGKVTSEILL